jgi:hypothetical protein
MNQANENTKRLKREIFIKGLLVGLALGVFICAIINTIQYITSLSA